MKGACRQGDALVGEPWRQLCVIGMGQEHANGVLVHGDVAFQPGLGPVLGDVLAFHPVVHRTKGSFANGTLRARSARGRSPRRGGGPPRADGPARPGCGSRGGVLGPGPKQARADVGWLVGLVHMRRPDPNTAMEAPHVDFKVGVK